MDYTIYCDLAQQAARKAGDFAMTRLGEVGHQLKTESQLVTEVDHKAQAMIIAEIEQCWDEHGILAEEGEDGNLFCKAPSDGSDLYWIIDPIDGTRNYAYGLPLFCVSIALMDGGEPVMGVIYVPATKEMFHACRGGDAYCNGEKINCLTDGLHSNSMIALPGRQRGGVHPFVFRVLEDHVYEGLGSAALHYAYVAKGSCAGTCSWEVKLWDIAAGAAIVIAAGGEVSDVDGSKIFPLDCESYKGESLTPLAGGKLSHEQMLEMLLDSDR